MYISLIVSVIFESAFSGYGSGAVIILAYDWIDDELSLNWEDVLNLALRFETRPATEFKVQVKISHLTGNLFCVDFWNNLYRTQTNSNLHTHMT